MQEFHLRDLPLCVSEDYERCISPFQIALERIRPKGSCIWMIGDKAENDIRGARERISAVTLQKLHAGVGIETGENAPDIVPRTTTSCVV